MDVEPEVGSLATQVVKRWQGEGGRFYAMGGEAGVIRKGQITEARVFGQMESYDPATDSWQSHAPMPTPLHAVSTAVLGD